MVNEFPVFILSHGRPDRVKTIHTLRRQGFSGRIFVVCDDKDASLGAYREKFGRDLIVFSKEQAAQGFDEGDNFKDRRAVVYARNEMWRIARDAGAPKFIVMDDDYHVFSYRRTDKGEYTGHSVRGGLDRLFAETFAFLDCGFDCLAWCQGGDHIGGADQELRFKRKIMNAFFCDVEKPFPFLGRINEDATTAAALGRMGYKFGTIMFLQLDQSDTQSNPGGLTDIYLSLGTFVKSFYSVMFCPSAVKVKDMGEVGRRLHHATDWSACAAKIIREHHRKPRAA
jgi:hypothetical protein